MDKLNKSSQTNKIICQGFLCSHNADEKIEVNAGIFGTISLSLCSSCAKKFC